jgi:pimeloyl-ACP methyl ester carboxylesterase/DNA-binding SARP family transcriptional activator
MSEEIPQVRYADAAGAQIAYQAFGEGPVTIVAIPPMAQNIELAWEWPTLRRMFERFASFSRYVHFDKRGTGASDRSIPVPEIDQRVDDLRAVMDAAEVDHAFLYGVSEGGPMTLLFAATYPERVDGVILSSTGARLIDLDAPSDGDGDRERVTEMMLRFADLRGTPESIAADIFAPSLAGDPAFRRWHQKYERQSASRESLLTLLQMNAQLDVREILPDVRAPVLLLHKTDDFVVPVRFAREAAAALPDARLVELPGIDHFSYAGDVDRELDEIERFVTGAVVEPTRRVHQPAVELAMLGRFAVTVDGNEVPASEWGSRRARQLLKRLAIARGWPVSRDELIEMLWPDSDEPDRLLARLSVQLSAVRRVLQGGVVADRSSIRLDIGHVAVDLVRFDRLDDDRAIVAAYAGELLPDDRFEEWTEGARAETRARFLAAAHRLLDSALVDETDGEVAVLAAQILSVEPFDERAHHCLVVAHHRRGSLDAANAAYETYRTRMDELEVDAQPFARLVDSPRSEGTAT